MAKRQYIRSRDVEQRARFWQKIQWRIEALAWDTLYWWPFRMMSMERASNMGGWLARRLGPRLSQHKVALRNLKLAFPEKTTSQIQSLAEAAWENVGRTAGELPHLHRISPYGTGQRVEVIGAEHLDAIEASAQGAVFVSGHLANWEIMAAVICQRPVDCLVTYRALNNPHIDRRLNKIRHDYGIGILTPKGLGTRDLMGALSEGRSVALMNDQKFREGVPALFFGHVAMTAPGPSRLARRYDVPLVFVSTVRTGPARFQVTIHPPRRVAQSETPQKDVQAMVDDITTFIEARIRQTPDQWFWMHRRWPKEAWRDAGV